MTDSRPQYVLWGVALDVLTPAAVRTRIAAAMTDQTPLRIATVNPDFLLRARTDVQFRACLAAADLRIADGVGIALVGRLAGRRISRYPGADLMNDILAHAAQKGWHVHILARGDGLSPWTRVRTVLTALYPDVTCTGTDAMIASENGEGVDAIAQDTRGVFACIDKPILVLCSLGAPAQEHVLERMRADGVSAVMIGVGGALDFLTGVVPRAPRWLRRVGLEWLWRTTVRPERLKKMVRSVIVFPCFVVYDWIKSKR